MIADDPNVIMRCLVVHHESYIDGRSFKNDDYSRRSILPQQSEETSCIKYESQAFRIIELPSRAHSRTLPVVGKKNRNQALANVLQAVRILRSRISFVVMLSMFHMLGNR